MKNLVNFNTIVKCYKCKKTGYFIETPRGADCTTCPLCHQTDFMYRYYEKYKNIIDKMDEEYDIKRDKDIEKYDYNYNKIYNIILDFDFCYNCKIIYDTGCCHSNNGCTDNVYNALLISKYEYEGNIYEGMPMFDNIEEYLEKANNIKILKLDCQNNCNTCSKASYKSKYPDDYICCNKYDI